jgi:hypothetical protein
LRLIALASALQHVGSNDALMSSNDESIPHMTDQKRDSLSGADLAGAAKQADQIARDTRDTDQQRVAAAEHEAAENLADNAATIRRTAADLRATREQLRDNAEELNELSDAADTLKSQTTKIREELQGISESESEGPKSR